MSLDKWIENDEDNKKAKKKPPPKKEKVENATDELVQKTPPKVNNIKDSRLLTKFILTCSDSKCKYKKTLKKKTLKDKDKICPRCKKEMKIKILDN